MSIAGTDVRSLSLREKLSSVFDRVRGLVAGDSDHSAARRMAGQAFLIRVFGAGILFLSQILLARWMGRYEFGIYVYVWTWLVLIGGLAPLGIAYSAQRFIPEYLAAKDFDRLRGFITGSRMLSFGLGALFATAGLTALHYFGGYVGAHYFLPWLLALVTIPLFTLAGAQDGIARSYNWTDIALIPHFVGQPILMLALLGAAYLAGVSTGAGTAMAATAISIWATVIVQSALLRRRLSAQVASGPRRFEIPRWFRTALPIFLVDGFYFLLTSTDIIVLQLFVDPSDTGVYYAATKTLVLISFIYYAVSAAFAHRFSEAHFSDQHDKLEGFIREAVRWTFWPSLAMAVVLLALGQPILSLFGAGFSEGYPLLFMLVLGLLARSTVGPAERLLIMVGEQRICAVIYATAFVTNLVLCFTLIPQIGLIGAAISTATALAVETALLYFMARRRLGVHIFFWRR